MDPFTIGLIAGVGFLVSCFLSGWAVKKTKNSLREKVKKNLEAMIDESFFNYTAFSFERIIVKKFGKTHAAKSLITIYRQAKVFLSSNVADKIENMVKNGTNNISSFLNNIEKTKSGFLQLSNSIVTQKEFLKLVKGIPKMLVTANNRLKNNEINQAQVEATTSGLSLANIRVEISYFWSNAYKTLGEYNNSKEGKEILRDFSVLFDKNNCFRYLSFKKNAIDCKGLKDLFYGYKEGSMLKYLDISSNNIGVKGAKLIANLLKENKLPNLKILDISDNPLGQEGYKFIIKSLLKNEHLVALNLSTTHVKKYYNSNSIEVIIPALLWLDIIDINKNNCSKLKYIAIDNIFENSDERYNKVLEEAINREECKLKALSLNGKIFPISFRNMDSKFKRPKVKEQKDIIIKCGKEKPNDNFSYFLHGEILGRPHENNNNSHYEEVNWEELKENFDKSLMEEVENKYPNLFNESTLLLLSSSNSEEGTYDYYEDNGEYDENSYENYGSTHKNFRN